MMFECFENLLVMAVENPHKVVWDLPMLTQSEEQRQLVEWNKTLSPYPRPGWLLHELFLDQAKENPDGIALIEYGGLKRIISYSELESMAEKVARQMRALGIEGDSTVGLLMTNDIAETIAATYGTLMAGGAYVPLDPSYPDERIKLIADDAALRVLLVKDEDAFAKHGSLVGCPVLSVAKILDDALLPEPSAVNWCPPALNTSSYILYTSGTTGKPKGVVLEHASLSSFIQTRAFCVYKGLGLGSRLLNSSPITFDMSTNAQMCTLSVGATLVLAPKCVLLNELEILINTVKITHLCMTPSVFELIVECSFPSLVCITLAGEHVPQHQLEMWRDKVQHFVVGYGPTETDMCTAMEFNSSVEHRSSNIIGFPLPNVTYYVLDTHLQPVPVGVVGELYIGGDCVARGYLNRPGITRKAFIKNPFSSDDGSRIYKTGDMVKLLHDGSIFFIGRKDRQVKIRGHRVELGEVEAALRSANSYVTQAVVLVDDQSLLGFVTPVSVDAFAVRTGASKVLPHYMIPSVVLAVDSIPTTLSGKADHHALLSLLAESNASHRRGGSSSSERPGQHVVPLSPLEDAVLAIYRKETRNEGMGMASDFFESGGDSLKAVRIVVSLRTLPEEHPELQIGKGFSTLSVVHILRHLTPGALLQSCLGSSLSIQQLTQD
ncbi:MAG: amino acid adenylation domain-containing protein, partial [Gammaproteobacteria bacterium]|nr:amino acid adenylation domain-containing protein [Gammaproteobacteria bacterium]